MSIDGRIAGAKGAPVRLSNEDDTRRVHRLRDESDAILVGVNTVLRDDPALLVKKGYVPKPRLLGPLRVVLDTNLRTPRAARVMNADAPTLLCVGPGKSRDVAAKNVEVEEFPLDANGQVLLGSVLERLEARGVKQLMVEGGSHVLGSFVTQGLFDEFTVFVAPRALGEGPALLALDRGETTFLRFEHAERLGDGVLVTFKPG